MQTVFLFVLSCSAVCWSTLACFIRLTAALTDQPASCILLVWLLSWTICLLTDGLVSWQLSVCVRVDL